MPIDSEVPYVMRLMLKGRRRRNDKVKSDEKLRHQKQFKKPEPRIFQAKGKENAPLNIRSPTLSSTAISRNVRKTTRKLSRLSIDKKKYINWAPFKTGILKKNQHFCKKNEKGAIAKTLRFFQARGKVYDDLEYNHIKYWIQQKEKEFGMKTNGRIERKRGRPEILQQSTLRKIDMKIMEIVSSRKYLVNSTNLYPVIIHVIKECGEGAKIGEGYDKLKVGSTWINDRCRRLNLSMRKPTTATCKIPENWEDLKSMFICRLAYFIHRHALTPDDVYNLDQTSVQLNPHANGGKTRSRIGSKDVAVYNNDDKQQITVVPVVSASGKKCPLQLIFKGTEGFTKTGKKLNGSIPDYKSGFANLNATYPGSIYAQTRNHWSNHQTNIELLEKVILPFAEQNKRMRRELGIEKVVSDKIVVVLDCWPVQTTEKFRYEVTAKFPEVILCYLPPNLTAKLQPIYGCCHKF